MIEQHTNTNNYNDSRVIVFASGNRTFVDITSIRLIAAAVVFLSVIIAGVIINVPLIISGLIPILSVLISGIINLNLVIQ